MAAKDPTAPAVALLPTSPTPDLRDIRPRLIEAIAVVELVRNLLLAEHDAGSKRIALEGVIRTLYELNEDIGYAWSACAGAPS